MKEKNRNLTYLSIGIIVLIVAGWILTYYFLEGNEARGTFGDMFGSLNALYSGFALAGIIITILLQKNELKLQREELKETRKEFKIQNETLNIQRFENTFFNLLNLHHKIVDEIDYRRIKGKNPWSNVDYLMGTNDEDDGETITITGRDVFKYHYKKLLDELKHAENPKQVYLQHYEKYQSDFGHYFRNLYRIFKLVDTSKFFVSEKEIETQILKRKYRYTSIARAQLSDYELLWLFYNGISENGIEKFKPLIEKYSLLKNLPENKLANINDLDFYNKSAYKNTCG
jgi:uncharacterized membrane protein